MKAKLLFNEEENIIDTNTNSSNKLQPVISNYSFKKGS